MGKTVRFVVQEFLIANNITPYQLAAHTEGIIARNSIYALARNQGARVGLQTLAKLALTLEQLTGKRISLDDLMVLEHTEQSAPKLQQVAKSGSVPKDRPFYTLAGAARLVSSNATAAELLQAIQCHQTLKAVEIRPGVYRVSEQAISAYKRLRARGEHQRTPSPRGSKSPA